MGLDRTGNSAFIDVIDVCPGLQDKYAPIDYDKVREAGFKGVYIQCSLYSSTPNLGYDRNAEAAHKAGLAVGAYHFAACDSDAVEQARFFLRRLKKIGLRPGDLPPCMDLEFAKLTLEKKGPAYVVSWGEAFMSVLNGAMIEAGITNPPLWYSFPNFCGGLQPYLGKSLLASGPMWLARYRANKGPLAAWYPPDDWEPDLVPKGCHKPVMAQYSGNDGLPVPGIVGACDRNVFFGSQGDWAEFRGLQRPVHSTEYEIK